MGYNKNVTPYVRKALEEAKKAPGSVTTYVHNNAYTEAELPECFERNSEGLLKNMVHAYYTHVQLKRMVRPAHSTSVH